jgi:flagellar motor switch protein FliN/FliY
MPAANVDRDRVAALLNEAAEAAAAVLSTTQLLSGVVGEGTLPEEFVPGDGARAASVDIRGLNGTVTIAVSAGLAAEIVAGPMGNAGFLAVVEQAVGRASQVLDQAAPRAIRIGVAEEVDAETWFRTAGAGWFFGAAPLFAGEDHWASLALVLDDPALSTHDDDTDDGPPVYEPPLAGGDAVGGGLAAGIGGHYPLKLLHDVEMDVTVELGRTRMSVRSILGLTPGAVIELDRAAGAPVDLLVNGTLIGRGEVVVIDEEFGVRIAEIIGRHDED